MQRQILAVTSFVSLVATSLFFGMLTPAQADPTPKAPGSVIGRVVTVDGKPIAGARIWFDDGETPEQKGANPEAKSGADGRFRLEGLVPTIRKRQDLWIEAEGFAREYRQDLTVFSHGESDIGDVPLSAGCRISGQLVDIDGKPRPNVEATVSTTRWERCRTIYTLCDSKITTDKEGKFVTQRLPAGQSVVEFAVIPERRLAFHIAQVQPGTSEHSTGIIRLEEDHPLVIQVQDSDKKPIAGAELQFSPPLWRTESDSTGRVVLRGHGPGSFFQINARMLGFAGFGRIYKFNDLQLGEPVQVTVTLQRSGWIEGTVIDGTSGEPVRIENIAICNAVQRPDGTIVRSGCRNGDFEQEEPGKFRVAFVAGDDYALTIQANGYRDAEKFMPIRLRPPGDIDAGTIAVFKAGEKAKGAAAPKQRIIGNVTRNGEPIPNAWVALGKMRVDNDLANATVRRGRSVPPTSFFSEAVLTSADGSYSIPIETPGECSLVVDAPSIALLTVEPVKVAPNVDLKLDIACPEQGRITGRVTNVPPELAGHLYVVAFDSQFFKTEAAVNRDGTFRLDRIPSGEIGLKVGHSGNLDSELPWSSKISIPKKAETAKPEPWKRATIVHVEAGETREIDLSLPRE